MGKRKKSTRKPQGPKKREPLPTIFPCLFCNHERSVIVKLEKKLGVGRLNCTICGQTFETGINYLSAPVDVYADWIDACDTVAKQATSFEADEAGGSDRHEEYGGRRATSEELEDLDDIEDDDEEEMAV